MNKYYFKRRFCRVCTDGIDKYIVNVKHCPRCGRRTHKIWIRDLLCVTAFWLVTITFLSTAYYALTTHNISNECRETWKNNEPCEID